MTEPRVVAVIDVGSNSVRLLVARALSPSAFEVIDEERFDARLAQGQDDGVLSAAGIERGLRALRIMAQVARSHAPDSIVAVGTEALRRAPNAHEFLEAAREQTGLAVRVLSEREEAFASFLGAVNSTKLTDGYLVDIGGGSLELTRVEGRQLKSSQSVPLGAIYAAEQFLTSDPPQPKEIRALRKAVRQFLGEHEPAATLFGVGGAIRNLARVSRMRSNYPLRRLHEYVMPVREVRRLASSLGSSSAEQRRRITGVTPGRADIIHGPAIVLDEVMRLLGAEELCVTGQGLREGLVWQEIRGEGAVLDDVRAASIGGLARANGVEESAAEPVVTAAAALFDATASLHGYDEAERDLLVGAARLAGVGMHVDFYNRDRHAEYLVYSGDLHGFTHREIVLLASIVRWSDRGVPNMSSYGSIIREDDARRAFVLTSLLGTARAVHRRSPSPVARFDVHVRNGEVALGLAAEGPVDAELLELERQQLRLEQALRAPVEVWVETLALAGEGAERARLDEPLQVG